MQLNASQQYSQQLQMRMADCERELVQLRIMHEQSLQRWQQQMQARDSTQLEETARVQAESTKLNARV